MPRKKSSSGYDPINLDNLEQAIKLWRELNAMHGDATKFVENYDKYMTKIDTLVGKQRDGNHKRLQDLEDELRHYKNIAQEQANIDKLKERELAIEREHKELEKERVRQAKEQEKINKQNEATIRRLNNYNRTNSMPNGTTQLGWGNVGEYLTTNSSTYKNEYNRVYNHVYENVLSREKKAAAKEGRAIDYNYVQSQTNDGVTKSLEKSGFTKKMSTTAKIFQVATDTFKSAVDTIWKTFMAGSNNQKDIFEQTFEGISVRNRTTRKNYYDAQWKANNVLDSMGLFNNVDTAEIQKMWSTLATNGIKVDLSTEKSRADITAHAIETILTNKIVPYLDMSSASAQLLAESNPGFMKQIRGIGLATQDITGSSTFIEKHLQELVDDIGPMATLAENELGLQFAQLSGSYETLRDEYGLNDAQIGALYKNTATVYNNPYQALKRGSIDQRMAVAYGINDNIDFRDISAVDTYTRNATNYMTNMVPEGKMSPFWGGMLSSNGVVGVDAITAAIMNEKNINMDYVTQQGIKTANATNDAAERATEDYKNDTNQTNMTREQIWLSNMSNELTTIREYLGIFEQPITTLLKGIGTLFATWIGGKLLKGALGKLAGNLLGGTGGSSGGLMSILGAAATPATGILAATAVTALAAAVGQAVLGSETTVTDTDFESAKDRLGEGTTDIQANLDVGAGKSQAASDNLFLNSISDKGITNAWGWAGNNISNWFRKSFSVGDIKDLNKNQYENLFAENAMSAGNSDPEIFKGLVLSYLLLLDSAGRLGDASDFGLQGNITREALKAEIKSGKYGTEDYIQKVYVNTLVDGGYAPYINYKDQQKSVRWENYHRYGLDYVPYDDYVATLHEGEAVLSATTANELRNLLDEYRQTNQQAVNFDTIIQQQTSDLVYKMDEIISAISGVNVNTANYNENQGKTILRNSLSKIKSTKSF